MSNQTYQNTPGRINKLKGAILAYAQPVEVLGITGQQEKQPKNSGKTTIFRRYLPYAAKVTLPLLRKITRSLRQNHGQVITQILAPTAAFGTSSVEAAYLVFGHTDLEQDLRDLPNFITVADYGSRKPINDKELGSCE